ncbi:MAG: flippase-like domain-containing protein [Deltaproteobacteria bacterium]|nr:flippase-like domain-containing protein [Deltaproteobacteria bacterium]
MKIKLIAGLLLSGFLVYLSVRGIDFQSVVRGLITIRYGYALLFLAVAFLMQVLRSVRWGMILRPLEKIDQFTLFSVSNVGFLAIIAIPARIGELARPYLITKKSRIPMTCAVGTIFVERIFDSLGVLLIAVLTPVFTSVPPWLTRASLIFFWITIGFLTVTIFLVIKRDALLKALNPFFCRLSEKKALLVERLFHQFSDGLKIITDFKLLVQVSFLTVMIWLVDVAAIYILFIAFGFNLPPAAAVVLMIVLIIGIAIPTAPGFVGNWHFFCILGLGIFGVPRPEALSFAIIYHFLSIGILIVLGLLFLPFNQFSLSSLSTRISGS